MMRISLTPQIISNSYIAPVSIIDGKLYPNLDILYGTIRRELITASNNSLLIVPIKYWIFQYATIGMIYSL